MPGQESVLAHGFSECFNSKPTANTLQQEGYCIRELPFGLAEFIRVVQPLSVLFSVAYSGMGLNSVPFGIGLALAIVLMSPAGLEWNRFILGCALSFTRVH